MIRPGSASSAASGAKRCPTCGASFVHGEATCPRDGSTLEEALEDAFVGTVLAGTYRVTRMIAAGGMGRVYQAEHVRLGRSLVVKVMLESHAFKPDVLERAEREAQAIARIRSQHVVHVVDVLHTQDGRPCLVVDHLEGEDLSERLARTGRLPPGEAASVARQLCEGMHAAHSVGVVHRDLKPSNVFLSQEAEGYVAKILDFGVAKLEGSKDLTQTGALVGTPAYMAPEQALNAGRVDARTDVYAIGAILYHMLTGVPPYGTEDPTVALMAVLKGEPPRARSILRSIPEDLEAVLERAMARDPAHRTPSVEQLSGELRPFDTRTWVAGPGRSGAAGASGAPAHRWARLGTVALTAVAALLAAGWAAGFSGAVLMAAIGPGRPDGAQALIVPVTTAAVGLLVAVLGARALMGRWRSLPRIESHRAALLRATGAALATGATMEIFALAQRALTGGIAPPDDAQHAVALGAAGIAALVALTLVRWRG